MDSNLDGITDDLFVNVSIPLNANEIVTQITAVLLFAVAVSVLEHVCTAFLCPTGVFKWSRFGSILHDQGRVTMEMTALGHLRHQTSIPSSELYVRPLGAVIAFMWNDLTLVCVPSLLGSD